MDIQERNKKYIEYVELVSPKASWGKSLFNAFLIGGGICVFGQMCADILRYFLPMTDNVTISAWSSMIIITIAIFLTALGVFDNIARFAGAGTIVPITGFANSIASCAIEFKKEGLIFGLGAKMFFVAGPVIVNGVAFSIIAGVVYWIITLL